MSSVQVERFYLGCLAHASYLIGSEGVAAVIDPQPDVDLYIEAAARAGLTIEHVIETRLHADFVSGHYELAGRTGARIYLGDGSVGAFPHVAVKDCDSLKANGTPNVVACKMLPPVFHRRLLAQLAAAGDSNSCLAPGWSSTSSLSGCEDH
jgi:glyoxylase-like metal-dependent hydrolase (beta-lactamase superfamily II)